MSVVGKRLVKIGAIALLMASVVFGLGEAIRLSLADHKTSQKNHSLLDHIQAQAPAAPVYKSSIAPTLQAAAGVATRSLKTYYARRAYPGAPPFIPHSIDSEMNRTQRCNVCHEKGGFTPKFNAYVPITPHPHFVNCMQCHVAASDNSLFVKTQWRSIQPPAIQRPALPGSPPPMPHGLALRDQCLSCHAGPAAVTQIRTSHPERQSCTQCHVPQYTLSLFERPAMTR
jgi:nitrate reductase cytochrome c-type subunit